MSSSCFKSVLPSCASYNSFGQKTPKFKRPSEDCYFTTVMNSDTLIFSCTFLACLPARLSNMASNSLRLSLYCSNFSGSFKLLAKSSLPIPLQQALK